MYKQGGKEALIKMFDEAAKKAQQRPPEEQEIPAYKQGGEEGILRWLRQKRKRQSS